jgi:hypothetical protein
MRIPGLMRGFFIGIIRFTPLHIVGID